jgi:micrococcal nuclease
MKMRMKHCFLVLVLLTVVVVPSLGQKKLTTAEAKEHIGENATVCGFVVGTRYLDRTRGEPTFLNLDKRYPNTLFTVVIWGKNRQKFTVPEQTYKDRTICVTGRIVEHKGIPEMEAQDPGQIQFDKK